jgi:thiamine-monophosphate kinase
MPRGTGRSTGGTIAERRFHAWLRATLGTHGALPLGDDTAAVELPRGELALLTTDALTEGTHFLPGSPPRSIGAAAAAVSLSDIAAKGGRPIAFLLDLLLPTTTPESWARDVTLGAAAQLAAFGAFLVGGDTKPATSRAVVGTLVGTARPGRLAPRTAARPGERVFVTGAVGRGGYDATLLEGRPSPRVLAHVLDLRPRVAEGQLLAPIVRSMMDTSDGVADSARLLAEASGTQVVIRAEDLPIYPHLARAEPDPGRRLRRAFYGGDYELFGTIRPDQIRAARARLLRVGCPFTVVGRVERGHGAVLEVGSRRRPMPPAGWQPFGADRRRPDAH